MSAATAAAKAAEQVPTKISLTTPLKSAAPSGKTIIWLQCDFTQCTIIGDGVKAAATAVGWNFKSIPYQSENTATLVSAFKQALLDHPSAVAVSGIPEAEWASIIPAYKAAGVPIIISYVGPTPLTSTVVANVAGPSAKAAEAKVLSDWLVSDSGGKANVLVQRTDAFSLYKTGDDDFEADLKQQCSSCTTTDLQDSIPDDENGATVTAIVSALKRDPNINYVFISDGSFIPGLPAALKTAGLTKVKIMGFDPTVSNLSAVKQGTESVFTPSAQEFSGWLIMDATLRHLESMSYPANYGETPVQLLTTTSTFTVSGDYPEPTGYQQQFLKLWKVK